MSTSARPDRRTAERAVTERLLGGITLAQDSSRSSSAVKLVDLSLEDQELLLVMVEIAREEGRADQSWDQIEPALAACWKEAHLGGSELKWDEVVRYVRMACVRPA